MQETGEPSADTGRRVGGGTTLCGGTSLPNVDHLRFVRHHCGVLAHRVDAWDDELRADVC